MRSRFLTSALSAALAAGLFLSSCSSATSSATAVAVPPVKIALAKSSCSKPAPTTPRGWADAFAALGGKWAVADQAMSIRLPDGRSMWVFDDTMQGTLKGTALSNWRMPHSTIVLADRGCLSIHTGPKGTSLLPNSGKDFYWPASVTMDHGRILIYAQRIRAGGSGATMDFKVVGTRLAELSYSAGAVPRFLRWHRVPGMGLTPVQGPQWGAAVTPAGAYTYVYGTKQSTEPYVFGRAVYVARVPRGKLSQPLAYRYWTGSTWSPERGQAREIKGAAGGTSNTFSMHLLDGKWVGVTKKDDFLGDKIVVLKSDSPVGPFTEATVATTPTAEALKTGDMTYSAFGHPELSLSSGKLLITVCRNNMDSSKVLKDVRRGRPYFIEVALP